MVHLSESSLEGPLRSRYGEQSCPYCKSRWMGRFSFWPLLGDAPSCFPAWAQERYLGNSVTLSLSLSVTREVSRPQHICLCVLADSHLVPLLKTPLSCFPSGQRRGFLNLVPSASFLFQVPIRPFQQLTFATVPRGDSMDVEGGGDGSKLLVLAVPGEPLSCSLCFSLFVVPTLRYLTGWASPEPRR